jgi:hypothetical protein
VVCASVILVALKGILEGCVRLLIVVRSRK